MIKLSTSEFKELIKNGKWSRTARISEAMDGGRRLGEITLESKIKILFVGEVKVTYKESYNYDMDDVTTLVLGAEDQAETFVFDFSVTNEDGRDVGDLYVTQHLTDNFMTINLDDIDSSDAKDLKLVVEHNRHTDEKKTFIDVLAEALTA